MKGTTSTEGGVVAQARAESREEFVERFAEEKLLVVRLDAASGDVLERGLTRGAAETSRPWQPRSGLTDAGTVISPISDGFMKAAMEGRSAQRTLSVHKLRALLSMRAHCVVPLRKRAGRSLAERLTIGRSKSSDVMLNHPSVSKLHASFECDEVGMLYLCDESSTNNTQLNGRVLRSGEVVLFQEGDVIRFGDVEAFVCLPETLWDALAG